MERVYPVEKFLICSRFLRLSVFPSVSVLTLLEIKGQVLHRVRLHVKVPGWLLRVIFSENRESEDTHEKSILLLFRQNIPLSELIQGNIVYSSHDLFCGRNLGKIEI